VALEALFGAGARDDVLPVAPTKLGPQPPLFLPQFLEAILELPHLGLALEIVSFRQLVPQFNATLAELFDLAVDFFQFSHFPFQRRWTRAIPASQDVNPGPVAKTLFLHYNVT
jgi:hypothetical protein